MGHTENRIEYHGRPEQTADQLPRRNAEYAADLPFTEKQHSDPRTSVPPRNERKLPSNTPTERLNCALTGDWSPNSSPAAIIMPK